MPNYYLILFPSDLCDITLPHKHCVCTVADRSCERPLYATLQSSGWSGGERDQFCPGNAGGDTQSLLLSELVELAAPVLPPIIHKARLSSHDDRAHRPLMALITVYREGWGHLERHTQKLKAQRRTSEDEMRVLQRGWK